MYLLLYIGVIMIVYVSAFKDDFKKEAIEKVTPAIVITSVFFLLLSILGSL